MNDPAALADRDDHPPEPWWWDDVCEGRAVETVWPAGGVL